MRSEFVQHLSPAVVITVSRFPVPPLLRYLFGP
jgi:hypothetical protein